jgi:hypothetical protein
LLTVILCILVVDGQIVLESPSLLLLVEVLGSLSGAGSDERFDRFCLRTVSESVDDDDDEGIDDDDDEGVWPRVACCEVSLSVNERILRT